MEVLTETFFCAGLSEPHMNILLDSMEEARPLVVLGMERPHLLYDLLSLRIAVPSFRYSRNAFIKSKC